MDTITIQKKNEVFLNIQTDAGIEMELSEHFQFFVPGYKFMPAYRNRMWDGKIRLFDSRKKTLYTGLHKYLQEFCAVRDYNLKVIESPAYGALESALSPDINGLLSQLSLSVNGGDIIPRQYQLEGLSHTLSREKTLLLSPTASGKSLIIYLAIRYYLDVFDGNVLLIVPTTSLVEQMYSDFGDYSSKDTWSHADNCHRIYSGREKHNVNQRVIISTWQSVYKLPQSWFSSFGMVV